MDIQAFQAQMQLVGQLTSQRLEGLAKAAIWLEMAHLQLHWTEKKTWEVMRNVSKTISTAVQNDSLDTTCQSMQLATLLIMNKDG